ncbi:MULTISPECIES: response regulator [Clostridium]|uniref:response regulator transcription factor n=1 Tax=Clostridium TaxID=1485 RepID=UPI00257A58B5|nr:MULTISPECIES: response regulator [Clostridium]MBS4840888.1 response regulator [Clostridium sp.]MDU1401794.1 response regulator [Clostridium sp.]MDU1603997.1 response regulator [Clostridium sp.]MDU2894825.1 response regulator [Clostridium sp.]MDU3007244.1 response regulator [Clostridium sp.]
MKIIVVDDDNIIRMGLTKMIEKIDESYEVISSFQNGALTLEYLKNHSKEVDLVITDIKMPVMTGIELIENSIKELDKSPLFLVLSGYDEFNYVRDTMKMGAFNYLLKPIKRDELKKILKEVDERINEIKSNDKIIDKSIEILKKDFFKNILFSSKELNKKVENPLLENLQLNENYQYKMIVLNKKVDSSILYDFIKGIVDVHKDIEYSSFGYNDSVYIIFYINTKTNNNYNDIFEFIVNKSDCFIELNISVYILDDTDKIWRLREQSKLVKKMKENADESLNVKKYYLTQDERLKEILSSDLNDVNNNITVIKLAKDYIINNYNKNISLKDVADEVYLSQNYLSELFKKEIGEGFYDFLSKYRIKKAKEVLLTTNLKVYEIAQMVGYNDSITFGRAFKKITGTTPNNFRNNREN